jgi:hypothetical protein
MNVIDGVCFVYIEIKSLIVKEEMVVCSDGFDLG